ncbi:MAG: BREX-1 system adenine-specific DNA-methyltransferase PglX, partial [Chloroflexota bacterium]
MNKAKLKTYAPQARKDFISAVTARAHRMGLAEKNGSVAIAPAEKSGDYVIIAGQSWPAKINRQRDNLIALIERDGFSQTMEAVAYTWFNRFAALRYMEIHDYLKHGYRVLSSREGGLPEILNAAPELAQNRELPDLNPQQVIELKLAGDQDGELYRLTLIAQCNALSSVMPFLFERIDNETELLLPDNLLLTDSVIAKLVETIPEEDWQQVEIIGWLYQFYISEKKDQVIGKVVKSEDIPAATQLFTPNWIVQYLVQNSVGRLWLMANPASMLKSQWPYYIEPAEQTPEVQAQLDALIQTRMDEDGGSLNPETITVLDPACGSGHILVEAYEVLKAIYLERGYQPRNIPRLILENNIYGLDIDDRAAQLAGFALLMKARADDRRLLINPPKLNVLSLQESMGLDVAELAQALSGYATLIRATIASLIDTFANAKTYGSLIQISPELNVQLTAMDEGLQLAIKNGDLLAQEAALNLLPLVRQARILGMQFDAVVANPPYMGAKGMTDAVKSFLKSVYSEATGDLFVAFIKAAHALSKPQGVLSMVTMHTWMFLSSYEKFRSWFLNGSTIESMVHLGPGGFEGLSKYIVQTVMFVGMKSHIASHTGKFIRLVEQESDKEKRDVLVNSSSGYTHLQTQEAFDLLPNRTLAYWLPQHAISLFSDERSNRLGKIADLKQGLLTTDNLRFLRYWHELDFNQIGFGFHDRASAANSGIKWFPINKGGEARKWYGNIEYVVNWKNDGQEMHEEVISKYPYLKGNSGLVLKTTNPYFREAITWTDISNAKFGARYLPNGFLFEKSGSCLFTKDFELILGLMCSRLSDYFFGAINPSLHFQVGDVGNLPVIREIEKKIATDTVVKNVGIAISLARTDWDGFETSWDFRVLPLLIIEVQEIGIEKSWERWRERSDDAIVRTKEIEEDNNRLFIEAYGLQGELSQDVPEEQITLTRADRAKDCQRLISYAIGCMMGRYSLDEPGLIYAHAGNVGFNPDRYKTFPVDADGIVPITDELWFEDDAANRINEGSCGITPKSVRSEPSHFP